MVIILTSINIRVHERDKEEILKLKNSKTARLQYNTEEAPILDIFVPE